MIQNFKGKQNTNGFGRNTQNINRKGRPIDTIAFVTRERIRTGDFTIGTEQVLLYVKEKGYALIQRTFKSG